MLIVLRELGDGGLRTCCLLYGVYTSLTLQCMQLSFKRHDTRDAIVDIEIALKGVFSPNPSFLRTCPARPIRAHTCSGIARRLYGCGWAQAARKIRELRGSGRAAGSGAHYRGAARVLRQRMLLAEALLRQHIDGVARASSAGTKSGSSARSLVLLTTLAPVSRCARVEDQLGLGGESNSKIAADGSDSGTCRARVTSIDLLTSSASTS